MKKKKLNNCSKTAILIFLCIITRDWNFLELQWIKKNEWRIHLQKNNSSDWLKAHQIYLLRNWVFATNYDLLIPISLQAKVVDLKYFKLSLYVRPNNLSLKYQRF